MEDSFINYHLSDLYEESESSVSLLEDQRYSGKKLIAEGGLKVVYEAFDHHCNRKVALAQIKTTGHSMGQALDFIREVQLCSMLEHPNIVRVYDIGIDEEGPWFSMELLDGLPLSKHVEMKSLGTQDFLTLTKAVCDAISAAHEKDVLHLDIKPENVIIGDYGKITVCDWGLGNSVDSFRVKDAGRAMYIKGTPGFMAPEQFSSNQPNTKASDVYGLGALLYYLLTKQPIPQEESPDKDSVGKPRPDFGHEKIPSRLVPVLKKALSYDASDRYPDALSFSEEIQKFMHGFATIAENASFFTQVKLFIQRNKAISFATLFFMGLTVLSSAIYLNKLSQSNQETQEALAVSEVERQRAEKAKENAITARLQAREAQKKAEEALVSLKREEDMRMSLNNSFSEFLVDGNRTALDDFHFKKALITARKAVELAPQNREALIQLGFTHFILQNYKESAKLLRKAKMKKLQDLLVIAEASAGMKNVTADELINIIENIEPTRNYVLIYILHYDSKKRPLVDHAKVVEAFFRKRNPGLVEEFEYNAESKTLTIQGEGLKFGVPTIYKEHRINYLSSLPIETLIVTDHPHHRKVNNNPAPSRATTVEFITK